MAFWYRNVMPLIAHLVTFPQYLFWQTVFRIFCNLLTAFKLELFYFHLVPLIYVVTVWVSDNLSVILKENRRSCIIISVYEIYFWSECHTYFWNECQMYFLEGSAIESQGRQFIPCIIMILIFMVCISYILISFLHD